MFFRYEGIPSFKVYWKDELVATVEKNAQTYEIHVLTNEINKMPFNHKAGPLEVAQFLEDRCFPSDRDGKEELLKALGLSEYNHLNIIRKTHGTDFDDFLWIKFKEDPEELCWKDVKLR